MSVFQRVFQSVNKGQAGMVGMVCWNLWNRRNCWVWDHVNISIVGLKSRIHHMLDEWNKAQEEKQKAAALLQNRDRTWRKPPAGWIKINTDAACVPGTDQFGIGCVARDEHGCFLRARCTLIHRSVQSREAEAIGLREALSWIKHWRNTKCIFECDAKLVVDAVNGDRGYSNFDMLIEDCVDIIKHFDEVLVTFVHRSANNVADLLAKAAYSMAGLQEWIHTAPDFITCNLDFEKA
ncbi:uncharacterized protein LOC141696076 [Apium graveolens]|uniref:uncharacterized protein LOC141696076 n=1 Tax=Apium graveolens TaxID=4045 RepID=UPI003D79C99F